MAKDIETHIFAHTGVDELDQAKIEEELNYEHYKARLCNMCCFREAALCGAHVLRNKTRFMGLCQKKLPLKWSQAAPCMGERVATCHLAATSQTDLKLVWSGARRSSIHRMCSMYATGVWHARCSGASKRCDARGRVCTHARTRDIDVLACRKSVTHVLWRLAARAA